MISDIRYWEKKAKGGINNGKTRIICKIKR